MIYVTGTVGIVTHVDKQSETVRVVIVARGRLIDTVLRPITAYFIVNRQHATKLLCLDRPQSTRYLSLIVNFSPQVRLMLH